MTENDSGNKVDNQQKVKQHGYLPVKASRLREYISFLYKN